LMLTADQPWENGNVEAPDMVTAGGRYFLFFAGNGFSSSDYAEGVAECSGPLGPCRDMSAQPILSSGAGVEGPGSADVFTAADGSYAIAFDGYLPGAVGYPNSRDLYIRSLDLSGAIPAVGSAP
jgi:Glycosyl hydrolases family 43